MIADCRLQFGKAASELNPLNPICNPIGSPICNLQSTISYIQNPDVGEIAIAFGVIQAIADDEAVLDREADVIDPDGHLAPRRLVQKACGRQGSRIACAQNVLKI